MDTSNSTSVNGLGRIIFVLLPIFIASVCFSPNNSFPDDNDGAKSSIFVFKNKKGSVIFQHKLHQERVKLDCSKCHTSFEQKFSDAVSVRDIAHEKCRACHKERGGPTKCFECHQERE